MRTMLNYRDFYQLELDRRQQHLNRLPDRFSSLLPDISFQKLSLLSDASEVNQFFLDKMVRFHAHNSFMPSIEKLGLPIIPTKDERAPICKICKIMRL